MHFTVNSPFPNDAAASKRRTMDGRTDTREDALQEMFFVDNEMTKSLQEKIVFFSTSFCRKNSTSIEYQKWWKTKAMENVENQCKIVANPGGAKRTSSSIFERS